MNSITSFETRGGRLVSYDPSRDLLLVEGATGESVIVIDLAQDRITIRSTGDLDLEAGGKLRLKGKEGVEVEAGGDLRLVSEAETIVRGKMIRIN